MPPSTLAVCVVNHEGLRRLGECIESILREEVAPEHVLVVDEGSTDGSPDLLQSRHPAVRILANAENRGPAHARNAGYRTLDARRILFVDNDVVLLPGCIATLDRALEANRSAVAAMPRVLHAHDPSRIQFDGASVYVLGNMKLHHPEALAAEIPATTRTIDSIVTACFLLDRDRFGDDDPFDEDFFYGLEDHDFGIRCRCLGHELLAVPSATCLHGTGTPGLSFRTFREYPTPRVVYHIRNRWWILLESYRAKTLVLLAPLLLLYESFLFAGAVRKGWLRAWGTAVVDTLGAIPRLHAKRSSIQKRRRLRDRDLLTGGPLPFRPHVTEGRVDRAALACLGVLADRYWRLVRRLV